MTDKEILELAEGFGFDKVALIDTADIEFNEAFRKACEENRCGNYGACYSCPPDCGTFEDGSGHDSQQEQAQSGKD